MIANIPKTSECKNLEFSWEIKKELRVLWRRPWGGACREEGNGEGLQSLLFRFWPRLAAYCFLVPQPGIEPAPPAVEARGLNHWTAREVPVRDCGELPPYILTSFGTNLGSIVICVLCRPKGHVGPCSG